MSGEDHVRGSEGQAQKHYRRESQRSTRNCSSCDVNNRIFRTQRILVIFCRSQCAIDLESSGALRQGCVHFAGSTRFDSRGQRLLLVYCIFKDCLAGPPLEQARISSVSSSDVARGKISRPRKPCVKACDRLGMSMKAKVWGRAHSISATCEFSCLGIFSVSM